MTRLPSAAVFVFVAASFAASDAGSAPRMPGAQAMSPGLRLEIHGCHYDCQCGSLKDFGCEQVYHRHLHMLCLPVRCRGDAKCEQTPPQGVCRHITPQ